MRLAKPARRNPRELAQAIIAALPSNPLIARTEVAGAGFINFFLTADAYARELANIHELGDRYGQSISETAKRSCSSSCPRTPPGPLHVGHGRQAAYGATLANLLTASGFEVAREYYINDAGRQVDILAASIWLRYLERWRESAFPRAMATDGDYVRADRRQLRAKVGASSVDRLPECWPISQRSAGRG